MKNLCNIGVQPIKCENKQGSDNLKEIHYKINGLIFKYSKRLINTDIKYKLYNQLCQLGIELATLQVPKSAQAKKDEILTKLRKICKAINLYVPMGDYNTDAQRTFQWLLSSYLHLKDNGKLKDIDNVIKMLEDIRTTKEEWKDYPITHNQALTKANQELLDIISNYYRIA